MFLAPAVRQEAMSEIAIRLVGLQHTEHVGLEKVRKCIIKQQQQQSGFKENQSTQQQEW